MCVCLDLLSLQYRERHRRRWNLDESTEVASLKCQKNVLICMIVICVMASLMWRLFLIHTEDAIVSFSNKDEKPQVEDSKRYMGF